MRLLELRCKKSAVFCYSSATWKIGTHRQARKGLFSIAQDLLWVKLTLLIFFFLEVRLSFQSLFSCSWLNAWSIWEREGSSVSGHQMPPTTTLTCNISRSPRSAMSRAVVFSSGCIWRQLKKLLLSRPLPRPLNQNLWGYSLAISIFQVSYEILMCSRYGDWVLIQRNKDILKIHLDPGFASETAGLQCGGISPVGVEFLAPPWSLAWYYKFGARLNVEVSPTLSFFYP